MDIFYVCDECDIEIDKEIGHCFIHPNSSISPVFPFMKEIRNIKKVKENLPDVKVKLNKKVYVASVKGRDNSFATVTLIEKPEVSFEVSWNAITRAIESDSSLIF